MRPDSYIPEEDDAGGPPVGDLPPWIKPVVLVAVLGLLGAGIATFAARMPAHSWSEIDDGFNKATDNGKPVFVFFTADWCPPCRQLKAGVLKDREVMAALDENYVLVKVDLSDRSGPVNMIAEQFGVRGIPTIILIDMESGEYDRFVGAGPAMESWIRSAAGAG